MNANGIDAGNGIDAVCTGAAMGDDRIRELDGLRGVAAAAVFLFHATNLAPPHSRIGDVLTLPFIAAFYASTAPVLLFFVLSGFVLGLPFFAHQAPPTYARFVIHRVFRIYPAY